MFPLAFFLREAVNLLLRGANRLNNSENIIRKVCFDAPPSLSEFIVPTGKSARLQLFRVRLSHERGKACARMSKVSMGNGGFTVAGLNLNVFERGGRKQHKHMYSCFLHPCG